MASASGSPGGPARGSSSPTGRESRPPWRPVGTASPSTSTGPWNRTESSNRSRSRTATGDILQHSSAHLVAKAVTEVIPGALPTHGPPTEEGFFYDFDTRPITEIGRASCRERV